MNYDSKILKYIENRLNENDRLDFEKQITNNKDLRLKVDTIKDLYDNAEIKSPGFNFKKNIYNRLGISNDLIDIIIDKSNNFLKVIGGRKYIVDIEPHFVTRSSNKSILFNKNFKEHSIFFEIFNVKNKSYINFKALENQNESVNVKFEINNNIEKFTNTIGDTGNIIIQEKVSIIEISKNNVRIGTLEINIS